MKRDPRVSALLRRAAERFDNDEKLYGVCVAIIRSMEFYDWATVKKAKDFVAEVYLCGPANPYQHYWLGPPGRNREFRVMCLLFAAELWDSGWEAK